MSVNLPKILVNRFEPSVLQKGEEIFQQGLYKNFDFVRNSFSAVFDEHLTIIKKKDNKDTFVFDCSCPTYLRNMTCPHLAALLYIIYSKNTKPRNIYDNISRKYYNSLWLTIAKENFSIYGNSKIYFKSKVDTKNQKITISCFSENDDFIFRFDLPELYWGKIWAQHRYSIFNNNEKKVRELLEKKKIKADYTDLLTGEKTDLEERMNLAGYKSWQQKFEESTWFLFSKLWFLTIDESKLRIKYVPEEQCLKIYSSVNNFSFIVPRKQISTLLTVLANHNPRLKKALNISDEMIILNYSLRVTNSLDLKITPVLIIPDEEKPIKISNKNKLKLVALGKYLYVESKGFFPYERSISYFDSSIFNYQEITIPNEDILSFLQEYRKIINSGKFYYVSPSLLSENYITSVDSAKVMVSKIEREWCYLDVRYQSRNETISFYDIYKSIQKGKRFLISKDNWLDLKLPEFDWIYELTPDQVEKISDQQVRIKMRTVNFFKLRSTLPPKSKFLSQDNAKVKLENLINFKTQHDPPKTDNPHYVLRDYQYTGYCWLWFIYENNFSGLLCDDMGLGKTYQSLALLEAVTMVRDKAKFLVICPTSVIPHWRDKLSLFKKRVHLHVYHGAERELKYLSREKYSVILTSYGIMRNDLEILKKIRFEVMIFDEIQSAKNKTSLTNAALNQLNGQVKIGLTGTPIENNLTELKALFDIILPDYLGSDYSFKKKYIEPIEQKRNESQIARLHRIINPFTLRRTKQQVLEELPPKTEEIRKCELSPDQVKLYQDVINTRASSMIAKLSKKEEQIPYLHVFSILNYLKQICNHPAQLETDTLDYRKYRSGKWDLFCELLEESLNSGFKVVVFSQYLNMLALIEAYLNDLGIEFATIKGSTKNRGEMIEKFNNDPNCMVFTGSLKAAGVGIDLIGGSVVIHYDRWWNAARENQATDRVHRIGQTRGVQVFKLITEGTLEEKIDQIIERKKDLMENLVKEDDASLVKTFNREELIELLSF